MCVLRMYLEKIETRKNYLICLSLLWIHDIQRLSFSYSPKQLERGSRLSLLTKRHQKREHFL